MRRADDPSSTVVAAAVIIPGGESVAIPIHHLDVLTKLPSDRVHIPTPLSLVLLLSPTSILLSQFAHSFSVHMCTITMVKKTREEEEKKKRKKKKKQQEEEEEGQNEEDKNEEEKSEALVFQAW